MNGLPVGLPVGLRQMPANSRKSCEPEMANWKPKNIPGSRATKLNEIEPGGLANCLSYDRLGSME
jgi:hypothetical protein